MSHRHNDNQVLSAKATMEQETSQKVALTAQYLFSN